MVGRSEKKLHRAPTEHTPLDGGPTYPIFCAVKATILGHMLAPFGGGLGGFEGGLRWFFYGSWASWNSSKFAYYTPFGQRIVVQRQHVKP